MDRIGEEGVIKLVEGAKDGYMITPGAWSRDGSRLYFSMWRPMLANPDPHDTTKNFGYVEFSGRPNGFAMKEGMPAFLGSATKDVWPTEVIHFDPEDVHPDVNETVLGLEGGQVQVNIRAECDYSGFSGWSKMDYENFDDGEYTISGKGYGTYNFPSNILGINVNMDVDLDFVNSEGIPASVFSTWRSLSLLLSAWVIYETRGNLDIRFLLLDPTLFLRPLH